MLLVEDVVTTGGALIAAVEALRDGGPDVEHALCVLDREEGGDEALAAARRQLCSRSSAGPTSACRSRLTAAFGGESAATPTRPPQLVRKAPIAAAYRSHRSAVNSA